MKKLMDLCVGVIRDAAKYRTNSSTRLRADAEYQAVRPKVMENQGYRCQFCGHTSRKNHCHHLDGDHNNNVPENMVAADTLCHAYHHLGQQASQDQFAHDNLGGNKTILAAIPELSAADLNLLQRAIGVALLDPAEAEVARAAHKLLSDRAEVVRESFGSFHTGDLGAGMTKLNDDEYANRVHVVGDLRLVFRENVLKNEGSRFLEDFASLPLKSWESVKNAHNKSA